MLMSIAHPVIRSKFVLMFPLVFSFTGEIMNRIRTFLCPALALTIGLFLAACDESQSQNPATGDEAAMSPKAAALEQMRDETEEVSGTASKGALPYSISYRIVGTPIVGSPVVVELQVRSGLGPHPVNLDYRINDATSMVFSESQPAHIRMNMADNESSVKQQVTVIPQREGRFFLNVSAAFETETGTQSTVVAVPIQVGTGTRELQEHGIVEVDESGEAVKILTND